MRNPVDDCRAKIKRANEHIDNLEMVLKNYADADPYTIRSEYDDKTGRLSLVFRDCKEMPVEVPLLVGEALHQLRSTLDHFVWSLVIDNKQTPTVHNQFPICGTETEYKKSGKYRLNGVSDDAKAFIKSVQPCHQGAQYDTHNLWVLKELNNTDKHRTLIVAGSRLTDEYDFVISPPITIAKERRWLQTAFTPIEDDVVLAWYETDVREVKVTGKPEIQTMINEADLPKDRLLVPALQQISRYIGEMIDMAAKSPDEATV